MRFVEVTYPRTLTWSLEDYAAGVEGALAEHGIRAGWLLGESFSSQVVWPLVARGRFHARGVILARGFVRHPAPWIVPRAERITTGLPLPLLRRMLAGYARVARIRFWRSPETLAGIGEFISRWTELHRQAAAHRLRLIAQNDPCSLAREVRPPGIRADGRGGPDRRGEARGAALVEAKLSGPACLQDYLERRSQCAQHGPEARGGPSRPVDGRNDLTWRREWWSRRPTGLGRRCRGNRRCGLARRSSAGPEIARLRSGHRQSSAAEPKLWRWAETAGKSNQMFPVGSVMNEPSLMLRSSSSTNTQSWDGCGSSE